MGLSEIFVEGTNYWHSLTKGPGRYSITSWPGLGKTTAIAGHRTTWSAPFRYINTLNDGDAITLKMPYGTFTYRVTHHRIVDNGDWSIIRNVGYDQLVLSACHPLYSASHRYVIFARLASVQVPGPSGRSSCPRPEPGPQNGRTSTSPSASPSPGGMTTSASASADAASRWDRPAPSGRASPPSRVTGT